MKRYDDDDTDDDSSSTASDSSDDASSASSDGDPPPTPTSQSHTALYAVVGLVVVLALAATVYFVSRTSSSSSAVSASSASGESDTGNGDSGAAGTIDGGEGGTTAKGASKTSAGGSSSTATASAASGSSSSTSRSTSSSSLPPNGVKAGIAGGDGFDNFAEYISWWYDWGADNSADHTATDVVYFNMLWGNGDIDETDADRLAAFKAITTTPAYILGFNEPDLSSSVSAGMDPKDAAELWEELIVPWKEKGSLLGSPAPGMQGGETWLAQFQGNITTEWDFTAAHIYQSSKEDVQNVIDHFKTFGKPIVITEWGCMNVTTGFDPITDQDFINAYVQDCVDLFESSDDVVGYAAIIDGSGVGDVWPLVDSNGDLSSSPVAVPPFSLSTSHPTSSSPPSTSPLPSPSSRRGGFLSKLNPAQQIKRTARAADPRKLNRFRGGGGAAQRRESLFQPLKEGDEPLGTLVVRVWKGRGLVAKDRNGLSDPYVVVRYGNARITSPTVPKSLDPSWDAPPSGAGEAKLEFPLYDSLALGRERVEIVCWDKDRVGSEYLGEVSLGLGEWWGGREGWKEGKPPLGFFDEENKPIWHILRSTRSRTTVSGELLVQVGFIPTGSSLSSPNAMLSPEQRSKIIGALQRVADELDGARRASREERVLLAAPTEGVGTSPIFDSAPLGDLPVEDPEETSSSSSSDSDGSTASGEESDSEDEEDEVASTSADENEDELRTATEAPAGYFDFPPALGASTSSSVQESPAEHEEAPQAPPVPAIVVEKTGSAASTPPVAPSPAPSSATSSTTASAQQQQRPSNKRVLTFPGFIKRRFSAQSLSTAPPSGTVTPGTGESDFASTTDFEGSSAAEDATKPRRRRFARRKKTSSEREDSLDVGDELVEMSLVAAAGGAGVPVLEGAAAGKRKKGKKGRGKKKHREGVSEAVEGEGEGEGGKRRKHKKKHHKKHGHGYTLEDEGGVAGLVQIEIVGAKGLPRFKNALRTSYDMDPFCVISFGRKIFRTRVIRHSLNPVWEERLWFHVGEAETHWTIGFTISDWDKISGNDHVGDVTVPLDQLLGTSIQPNARGLFPAGKDGRLVGDDFHDHELPLVLSASEKEAGDAKPTLQIRAKYTPYRSLRQQFWRIYALQYDIDESGTLSEVELFSMLDSLGSTLTKDTITSFFTRNNKTTDDELTIDEVVSCLEEEVMKPKEEKRVVDSSSGDGESGMVTPALGGAKMGPGGGASAGEFTDPVTAEPVEYDQADQSSDMKTLAPGTQILTNPEKGTIVEAPKPQGHVKPPSPPSRANSVEPSSTEEGEGNGKSVERVINIKECPLCRKPRLSGKAEASIITHLGVCASTDPTRVNRVLVTNYVTASQAQRKFLNKVFSKVMKGSYNLGADSANIIVQDRQTGTLQEEKMAVYVRLGIRLMYRGLQRNTEGARVRRLLDSLTEKQGKKFDSPASAKEIEPFIRFHNLNMEEVLDPLSSFKTFNQFFYRKLKPDARPVADPDDPKTLVSPADCRAMFFETVTDATSIWIKGREFSVARMLGDHYGLKASEYENGSLAIFRLAPQDYHRYHSPVDGVMGKQEYITGQYYTVNPMAIRSGISVYTENVRLVAGIDSPVFGEVMNVWVGAMMVASIEMTKKEGDEVKRGDEVGYFAFGGSTIVVVFKPNTVQFDQDLLTNSKHSIETLVRVGTRIGRAVEKA
ncbi:hypothetical protein JCM8547_009204 [Rhodosporidiobolus lusitaniae]